mmetsp:Transcript_6109/g.17336  ORF Transcript_6109/g.17336 Transcript_6109/m.17336 type:complete len:172 (+) Transcript_6109:88-603(+)
MECFKLVVPTNRQHGLFVGRNSREHAMNSICQTKQRARNELLVVLRDCNSCIPSCCCFSQKKAKKRKTTQFLQRENRVKIIVMIHSHYSYTFSVAIVLLRPTASAKGHSANISFVRHYFRFTTLVLGSSSVTKAQCVTIFFSSTIPTLHAVRGVASRLTKKKSHCAYYITS